MMVPDRDGLARCISEYPDFLSVYISFVIRSIGSAIEKAKEIVLVVATKLVVMSFQNLFNETDQEAIISYL
jgi:hypothetical protein